MVRLCHTFPMTLYTYFRSSCAYRVRIALNLKKLDYSMIPIHLLKNGGEQNGDSFKKINPMAQVPSLKTDSLTISQSVAIVEYLEEKYPETPLLPPSPEERAVVRQMYELINSGIQPLQGLAVTQFLDSEFNISPEQKQKWLNHWISKGLESFEALLQQHSGKYCLGDAITLADAFLIPQFFGAQRFKVNTDSFPLSRKIYDTCLQNDAFIKASPQQQPDFEP
jgi:maleylacetoacetate isomerase